MPNFVTIGQWEQNLLVKSRWCSQKSINELNILIVSVLFFFVLILVVFVVLKSLMLKFIFLRSDF